MKWIDISMPISPDMPVYKNKPEKKPQFTLQSDFETGRTYETRVSIDLHTGTHVDFPRHTIPGGALADGHDLNALYGRAFVADLSQVEDHISRDDLEAYRTQLTQADFLLLKTKNSLDTVFNPAFIFLDRTGAEFVVEYDLRAVAIDSLGIERDQPGHPTHKTILGAGQLIIEGLRLAHVAEGFYEFAGFPVSILGVEALPLRAALRPETA